jgi:hypothetical protein
MHRTGRTLVRLSTENRFRLDRFRRHHSLSRDRIVNDIVRDFLNTYSSEVDRRAGRRRAA